MTVNGVLNIISIALVVVAICQVVSSFRYLAEHKRKSQKYPFFALRGKIVHAILMQGASDDLLRMYRLSNQITQGVRDLGIGFHLAVFRDALHGLMEAAHSQNGGRMTVEFAQRYFSTQSLPFEEDLVELILSASYQNSLLFRLSLTKTGRKVVRVYCLLSARIKFLRNHPELSRKHSKSFEQQNSLDMELMEAGACAKRALCRA